MHIYLYMYYIRTAGVLSDGMALGATLTSFVDATVTGNWIPDPSIQQLADRPFYYLSI